MLEVNNVSLQDVNKAVEYVWKFTVRIEDADILWKYKRKLEREKLKNYIYP